jgi:hypothetical protein
VYSTCLAFIHDALGCIHQHREKNYIEGLRKVRERRKRQVDEPCGFNPPSNGVYQSGEGVRGKELHHLGHHLQALA